MSVSELTARSRDGGEGSRPILDVQGLTVALSGTAVNIVDDVSFQVSPGEILGLVGESGSGKTTLALAVLGYAKAGTSIVGGSVNLDGVDILSLPKARLRELRGTTVSYVPQDPVTWLDPAWRVGAQLLEALKVHGIGSTAPERQRHITEILEEVNLPANSELLARYPHQLSGGQQQRIAIAMAFACRPAVVVMDEPTTGLDVTTQAHVLRTVAGLAEHRGSAVVYVSHDLAVVAGLAQRIAVMYAGELIEVGRTDDIVHRPAHPYTRSLLAAAPDPRRRRPLIGVPGRVPPLGAAPPGCRFAERCEFSEPACRVNAIAEGMVPDAEGHRVRCRRWQFVRATRRTAVIEERRPHPAQAEQPHLDVQGLSAWHGDNRVLRDVDLAVARGACVALVGESGSGKTTLARCISGMHQWGVGEMRVDGDVLPWEPKKRSAETRRAVQYVFQNPYSSLNPRRSVRELIEQPVTHFDCGPGGDYVSDLLEQVSLSPRYARRYPSQLSGGERQRVAIARALAVSPNVLICDEVTSALDVSVQASILALLARLHAERLLTVLFVTHNLAVVRAVADRVVVLKDGEVVEKGFVDDVLDNPQDPYTRTLMKDTPGFAAGGHPDERNVL